MAVKSIIEIDINAPQFVAFKKMFDQYDAALKKMPQAWAGVAAGTASAADNFKTIVQMTASVVGAMRSMEKTQETVTKQTMTWEKSWKQVAGSTREVARNIRDATTSVFKWVSITGLISGLVGAGSLFGIDRLAAGVASTRRSSLGLGAGYGTQQSFMSNFGRLVDPESFLQSVAGAKFDVTKRVGLIGAGLTPQQIAGDTAQTAVTLLRQLKKIADTTNPALFQQVLQARRLEQFASPTDLERLRATKPGEFEQLVGQFGQRAPKFDLPDDVAKRWQDFITQMSNAGKSIETTFVKGLAPLAGPLTNLSSSIEKVIETLTQKGGPLERWITAAADGIERFAGYMGKPEFQEDVGKFVDGVGKMAAAVGKFVSWFSGPDPEVAAQRSATRGRVDKLREDRAEGKSSAFGQLLDVFKGGQLTTITTKGGKQVTVAADAAERLKGFLDALESEGAPIQTVGGYNKRKIFGTDKWSEHASGRAVDINQSGRDKVTEDFRKWVELHQEFLRRTMQKYGIVSGGDFKNPDLGHFELGRSGYAQPAPTVTINDNTGGNVNVTANGLKD